MVEITKEDIKKRLYFLTRFVQNHNGPTMQGALTSKSDFMGGILDRYINTLSDTLVFDKIILPMIDTNKTVKAIEDFYFYSPKKSVAGIAPDLFGIKVNDTIIPFTHFDNEWKPIDGMPQVEVKTFKAKDQMVTLRDQNYTGYLVLVDLNLRIDYIVPFLNEVVLDQSLVQEMQMDDEKFIVQDPSNKISKMTAVDYTSDKIADMELISITNANDFKAHSTLCGPRTSVRRMKEITQRKVRIVSGALHDRLDSYADISPRLNSLYEFNQSWNTRVGLPNDTKQLDFSAIKIDKIEICKYNNNGIVITPTEDGCKFNEFPLEVGKQYTVIFETLSRMDNDGEEYFMQKQCACHLPGLKTELLDKLKELIDTVD